MSQVVATRTGAIVFCQHGLGDPLVETLILDYVFRLREDGTLGPCLLFTEEPPGARAADPIVKRLARMEIHWMPLRYDVGHRQWKQRLRNVLRMLVASRRYTRGVKDIPMIGFLSYGGTYALLAQWLGLGPAMVVCFEPHSRYMVEMGMWAPRSLKTRVTGWLERMQMRYARALVVPTDAGRQLALAMQPRGQVVQQAITIDVRAARHDPQARAALRSELGFGDDMVLVYAGKFDGIYLSMAAYLDFLGGLLDASARIRAYIITTRQEIDRACGHAVLAKHAQRIALRPSVPAAELAAHLSAADIGVLAIPPSPAQAFRTPVKTAHYWAAGLPILIAQGVSDDHRVALEERVGLVVKDFTPDGTAALSRRIEDLLAGDREALRQACVSVAMRYRDTGLMVDRLRSLLQCV